MADDAEHLELHAGGRTVAISSPGKVMFPEHGETKADLARYYLAVGEPLMRTVRDRPTPPSSTQWMDATLGGTIHRALAATGGHVPRDSRARHADAEVDRSVR